MQQLVENTHIFRCNHKATKSRYPTGGKSAARWRHDAELVIFFTSPRAERISEGTLKGLKPSPSYSKNIAIKHRGGHFATPWLCEG